jgi:hypothetical protein
MSARRRSQPAAIIRQFARLVLRYSSGSIAVILSRTRFKGLTR